MRIHAITSIIATSLLFGCSNSTSSNEETGAVQTKDNIIDSASVATGKLGFGIQLSNNGFQIIEREYVTPFPTYILNGEVLNEGPFNKFDSYDYEGKVIDYSIIWNSDTLSASLKGFDPILVRCNEKGISEDKYFDTLWTYSEDQITLQLETNKYANVRWAVREENVYDEYIVDTVLSGSDSITFTPPSNVEAISIEVGLRSTGYPVAGSTPSVSSETMFAYHYVSRWAFFNLTLSNSSSN